MKYDRNTVWKSADGRECPIGELEDTHLVNVIKWVGDRHHYPFELLVALCQEAFERGFKHSFLMRAPIPHRDQQGKWVVDWKPVQF